MWGGEGRVGETVWEATVSGDHIAGISREVLYFAMYNVHFFAQIFEGK